VEKGENVGEISKRDYNQIEMDLEIIILMVEEQENIVLATPLPKQENANEDGEPHAHIDGNDIAIELHLL
jgi:hypothetical protein